MPPWLATASIEPPNTPGSSATIRAGQWAHFATLTGNCSKCSVSSQRGLVMGSHLGGHMRSIRRVFEACAYGLLATSCALDTQQVTSEAKNEEPQSVQGRGSGPELKNLTPLVRDSAADPENDPEFVRVRGLPGVLSWQNLAKNADHTKWQSPPYKGTKTDQADIVLVGMVTRKGHYMFEIERQSFQG